VKYRAADNQSLKLTAGKPAAAYLKRYPKWPLKGQKDFICCYDRA
jgi:hypothetical protein